MTNKRKRQPPAAKRKPAKAREPRERKPTQQERWEAERRQKRRRRRLQQAAVAVVLLGVVAGVVTWQVNIRRNESRAIAALTSGTCAFDRESDRGRVNQHAVQVGFRVEPPSGGVHAPTAASPGVFQAGEAPPDGQLVHAVEHGDIIIWHRGLPESEIGSLGSLVDARPDDVFLVERPTLPTAVAVTAWHKRLLCEDVEVTALRQFISRYADKGPERQPDDS